LKLVAHCLNRAAIGVIRQLGEPAWGRPHL